MGKPLNEGASPVPGDRAGGLRPEPAVQSQPKALIPSATVPCIVCGCALQSAIPGERENQPLGGTAFATRGHYGSTVFDPMDESALEINVCDLCLIRGGLADRVLHHKNRGPYRKRVMSWKRDAQAIEARRAETQSGSVHESPVPEGDAP